MSIAMLAKTFYREMEETFIDALKFTNLIVELEIKYHRNEFIQLLYMFRLFWNTL